MAVLTFAQEQGPLTNKNTTVAQPKKRLTPTATMPRCRKSLGIQ